MRMEIFLKGARSREQGARCRGLFVVGVGGCGEWEGELGVGGVVVIAKTACRVLT